jgi:hypothetical protein
MYAVKMAAIVLIAAAVAATAENLARLSAT